MDQYMIIIYDGLLKPIEVGEHEIEKSLFLDGSINGEFLKVLRLRKPKKYFNCFEIVTNASHVPKVKWKSYNKESKCECLQTSVNNCSNLILKLSDELTWPGTYLLDVYWFLSDFDINLHTDLIGALKKLKAWHLANINIIGEDLEDNKILEDFLDCKILKPDDLNIKFNNHIFWRGDIDIFDRSQPYKQEENNCDFTLKFTSTPSALLANITLQTMDDDKFADGFWIGNRLTIIDMIDRSTIPAMLQSGSCFDLSCCKDNESGKVMIEEFLKYPDNAGLLCSLPFAVTQEKFPKCFELNTVEWKEAVLSNNTQVALHPPEIDIHLKKLLLHIVVKPPPATKGRLNEITFEADVLHVTKELDPGFLLKEALEPPEELRSSLNPLKINDLTPFVLFKGNNQLLQAFYKIVTKFNSQLTCKDLSVIYTRLMERFNQSYFSTVDKHSTFCDHNFEVADEEVNIPIMSALKLHQAIEQERLPPTFDEFTMQKAYENPKLLGQFILKNKDKILQSLKDIKEKQQMKPLEERRDLGFGYYFNNPETERKEKEELYLTKLISYKTFSSGSIDLYPTNIYFKQSSDTSSSSGVQTPRKRRKKIERLADKLFQNRNRSTMVLRSMPKHSEDQSQPSKHGMTLRSTPQKVKYPKKNSRMSLQSRMPASSSSAYSHLCNDSPSVSSITSNSSIKSLTSRSTSNKKKVMDEVVRVLKSHNIDKDHPKFIECSKRLYSVSMAFLKGLTTSRGLKEQISRIVNENVKRVLEFELQSR